MLSEGQRNDINFAIPVLEHINIEAMYWQTVDMTAAICWITSMTMVENLLYHPEKGQSLSAAVTGGYIKSGI